jgi:hypothetical protein
MQMVVNSFVTSIGVIRCRRPNSEKILLKTSKGGRNLDSAQHLPEPRGGDHKSGATCRAVSRESDQKGSGVPPRRMRIFWDSLMLRVNGFSLWHS